ncbi:MAG: hypothetical protein JRH20_27325, partial [Deltaproteobacteria bacterium]|nr:hypothetical protein [Deltaproteobacteria bacterium]
GGVHRYKTIRLTNATIVVPAFDGADKLNTGNLQLVADTIIIDVDSKIVADGKGYQPVLCDNGPSPTASGGGRGGCAVRDSGGGGAHFGPGGRGTKDCFIVAPADSCQFPAEFEEACGFRDTSQTNDCDNVPDIGSCYNNDALPSVAGVAYPHSIYDPEFGAAGGDAGCRDGWESCSVGGAGGGRIVLAATNSQQTGSLQLEGAVSAKGYRGCGIGNDSGGGGAGGTILLVGDQVSVGATATLSSAGGLGGDTNAKGDPNAHCPPCAQAPGGTCDDCGGGGGGGIINVLAGQPATIHDQALFDVRGAVGGTCTICKGEAGGGAGELQLSGVYLGEFCDGYDNDFDGEVDEALGSESCGFGACTQTVDSCNVTQGMPNACVPLAETSCQPALSDGRSRFLVIVDTSGSMLTDLTGRPTFGDGSLGHPGFDTDGDGEHGDSRLYQAKSALTQVVNAYPEIDFGLARFAQGIGPDVNCQLAHWFECQGQCCTYDDPTNNSGGDPREGACTVDGGAAGMINVGPDSPGDECINYAGSCGQPRRGADILVGFERPIGQLLMWLDHNESSFSSSQSEGDHCNFSGGGDCELRGTGPTPLAGSLQAAADYLARIRAEDRVSSCRRYGVILLTDGAETCRGAPSQAAAELLTLGVETTVVGFSVLPGEQASLNAIARAGSSSGTRDALFVGDEQQLASTLANIVAESVRFERCNEVDDDCDLLVDEDFPLKGQACDNGQVGECLAAGVYVCKANGSGVECDAPLLSGSAETCNGKDDDCNGLVDEGLTDCVPCIPQPEVCNGRDDDCDGDTDEDLVTVICGTDVGECQPGTTACVAGVLLCEGGQGPTAELCNAMDDDCDGVVDGLARSCYPFANGCDAEGVCEGRCKPGAEVCTAGSWQSCVGAIGPDVESCDGFDNDCDGFVDNDAICPGGSQCIEGECSRPCAAGEFVCPVGQVCKDGWCMLDSCDRAACEARGPGFICKRGECVDVCVEVQCKSWERCERGACIDTTCYTQGCPSGQICLQAQCVADLCADVRCDGDSFCSMGQCLPLCETLRCPEGEACRVLVDAGERVVRCVVDPCATVICNPSYHCVDGSCEFEPCSGVSCSPGQSCAAG